MNRIKRYIDKEDVYLFCFAIVCAALVVWFQFIAYDWPEIFNRGQEASDLVVNISLSYISGWIVYLISVYIPKINERRKKSELIKPILKEIVDGFEFNIKNSLLIPNQENSKELYEKYKDKALSIQTNDLITLINAVDTQVEQRALLIDGMRKQPANNKEQITCICLAQRHKHAQKLEKINFLLPAEALAAINRVEYSDFINFASRQYDNFCDYCFCDTSFLAHYEAVINLDRYIKEKL